MFKNIDWKKWDVGWLSVLAGGVAGLLFLLVLAFTDSRAIEYSLVFFFVTRFATKEIFNYLKDKEL